MVPPPRMVPPPGVMAGANFMPPPSASSGRWMALAPQRQPSPRNSPSEQGGPPETTAISKLQDSPTEGLKIVADDD
ncbi:unnamed protein product [Gongylonema pulchrum]|uniref:Uncharacterized protein n=1 Tax=Gongylonema pulchrum TaxID=637853 RepID=A0A3P6QAE1_9BILA|nr:unnamed protein product [Gongylonema pulchrum]